MYRLSSLAGGAVRRVVAREDVPPASREEFDGYEAAVRVDAGGFEGSLAELVQLVSERKLDVLGVHLGEIVSCFLGNIDGLREGDAEALMELLSQFVLLLSLLIHWKVASMLPADDERETDEELYGMEQRDKLVGRFIELQAYARSAQAISQMLEAQALCVPRRAGLEEQFTDLAPDLLAGVDTAKLHSAWMRVVEREGARKAAEVDLGHVTVDSVSLPEALVIVETRLASLKEVTFGYLVSDAVTKLEVIVRFLAILELFKRGDVTLAQNEIFGDVTVKWVGASLGAR